MNTAISSPERNGVIKCPAPIHSASLSLGGGWCELWKLYLFTKRPRSSTSFWAKRDLQTSHAGTAAGSEQLAHLQLQPPFHPAEGQPEQRDGVPQIPISVLRCLSQERCRDPSVQAQLRSKVTCMPENSRTKFKREPASAGGGKGKGGIRGKIPMKRVFLKASGRQRFFFFFFKGKPL